MTVFIMWYDRTTYVVRKSEAEKMWYAAYHIFFWYHKERKYCTKVYQIFSCTTKKKKCGTECNTFFLVPQTFHKESKVLQNIPQFFSGGFFISSA